MEELDFFFALHGIKPETKLPTPVPCYKLQLCLTNIDLTKVKLIEDNVR